LDVSNLWPEVAKKAYPRVEWREDKGCLGWLFVPKGQEDSEAQVLTLGTVPPLRRALKGRQIECVHSTHLTKSVLSPLHQGESPYLMVPRVKTLG
jgi:hypothetical protein